MRMGWAGNTYVASDRWLQAEGEWDALRAVLPAENWIEVRYEELVANARSELERICAFLGVEYSEKMFDYVTDSTYSAPDPRLKLQWKSSMRAREAQLLDEKLGERLLLRGYELSGYPRISVSALSRMWLYLHSRVKVFLVRLDRYGIGLTFQEMLSRRLGLRRMHREAIGRMNQIVNANLK
jgi:hypothetical protein